MIERTCKCGNVVLCKAAQGRIPCRTCKPVPECLIDGCQAPQRGRGWCATHYSRWRVHGDPTVVGKAVRKFSPCKVDDCDGRTQGRPYCRKHHEAWQRYGDPLGAAPAPKYNEPCAFDGCDAVIGVGGGRGYCPTHHKRLRRYGDPRGACVACTFCGDEFYPVNSLRTACDACARFRIRWHGTSAAVIAERDGADCALCGEPVDFDLSWPDPLYPTVDHIIPWTRGGTHDPENLALAHFRCNASKGNRAPTSSSPATAR